MFKDYREVRDWLESFIPKVWGKEELGLARIEELLFRLGNPERKFKSIHVAGTSGKGSTAFYIARLLRFANEGSLTAIYSAMRSPLRSGPNKKRSTGTYSSFDFKIPSHSGLRPRRKLKSDSELDKRGLRHVFDWQQSFPSKIKIGLHVSPHLVDIRERMQINGELIPMDKFIRLIGEIREVVEQIYKERAELTPSYFEILVAASFLYFANEKVDWAVVEVGLGGRLDATNVLVPAVSVITNVGLDHTDILGNTAGKIAFEKAGIIKPGVPVVTAAKGKALGVIKKVAEGKKAQLFDYHPEFSSGSKEILKQVQNDVYVPSETAELTIKTVETLGFTLTGEQIKKAFSVGFPGRFEEIDKGIMLDGAHNPDKIRALIDFVKKSKIHNPKSIILVLAFKKGKNWKIMIDLLVKNLPIEQVIATEFQAVTDTGKFAAVPAEEIKQYLESRVESRVISNSQQAVFAALDSRLYDTDLLIVTGSLYLVGEVRTMWKG